LDRVAPANGLNAHNAHDALGDVEATIHLARQFATRSPALWAELLQAAHKAKVQSKLETFRPLELVTRFGGGEPRAYTGCFCGYSPGNAAQAAFFDLDAADPADLITASDEALFAAVDGTPKIIRGISTNKAPALLDLAAPSAEHLRRAAIIADAPEFRRRVGAAMAMLLPLKGPKIIWQIGELGYDISIDQNGRTGNKPILWNYNTEPARRQLYNTTAALAKLKQHPSFGSDNYSYDVAGTGKFLKVSDPSMNSITLTNFDMVTITMNPVFQKTGWWYDYMSGDSIQITDVNTGITLNPGEFKVYTDVNLNPKTKPSSVAQSEGLNSQLNIFPNPAQSKVSLVVTNVSETPVVKLFDVNGRDLNINISFNPRAQNEWICDLDLSGISKGLYFIQVNNGNSTELKQLIVSE
ncbi:MAG: T9SS type A sorting domain-containing protein, partial [Bacteroidia bacterium]